MIDAKSLDSFRGWARSIRNQAGDPDLRRAQTELLDRVEEALTSDTKDAGAAVEMRAWAMMQRQHGTYPAMASCFETVADYLCE